MRKEAEAAVISHRERLPDQTSPALVLSAMRKALARHEETIRRVVLLTLLYLLPALAATKPIFDPDIWWHLRTGQWIVEHGTVPTIDSFSSYGMGKPWIAYSWLFEVLVYGLYQTFGLVGLVLYPVVFSVLITAALHALVRRLVLHFPSELALTAFGLCGLAPLLNPRPWLFTILFFIIELNLLLAARRSGELRPLLFLPPLFALWANTHIQFVYGLFVLGLAAAEPVIERLLYRSRIDGDTKALPFNRLLLVTAACAVATLATPYHLSLYRTLIEIIGQTGQFQYISELASLPFRGPWDWCVLAVTLGAAFSLGWWREVRPFPFLLLAAGAFFSFRSSRDAWFVVIAAVAIIATFGSPAAAVDRFALTKLRALLVAGAVVIVFVVVGWMRHLSERDLELTQAKIFPVAAAAVVAERGYPGPLYNHFYWGGYLIWRLPHLPVSMDGRVNLHGDERIERSIQTWTGRRDWASDPELTAARLVIAGVNYPLTSLLRLDARFELVYEDAVAVVFIARSQPEGQGKPYAHKWQQAGTRLWPSAIGIDSR